MTTDTRTAPEAEVVPARHSVEWLTVAACSLADRAGLVDINDHEDPEAVAPWLRDALRGILRRAHREVTVAAFTDPTAKTPEDAWTAFEVALATVAGVELALENVTTDPVGWLG